MFTKACVDYTETIAHFTFGCGLLVGLLVSLMIIFIVHIDWKGRA
jgi:hypothetical protein